MAGPGGSEHGRINVKVVPDTDGFTRKVETVLKKYDKESIDVKVKADTESAEAQLKKLTEKYRKLEIKVELTNLIAVETKLAQLTRDKTVKIDVQVASATAEAEIDRLARKRRTAKVQAEAKTTEAESKLKRVARDRKATVRYRFIGDEAVRRLADLDERRVQRINFEFDDNKLQAKLRAIGNKNKIVADVTVNERNIRDIRKWIGSLGEEFREAGQELKENFERIRREQDRTARSVGRNDAWREAMEDYRDEVIRFERVMEAARKNADKARAARERRHMEQVRNAVRVLEREYRKFGRALPVEIELEVDKKKRLIALRNEIDRLRRQRVNIDVDVDYDRINRLFDLLNMRDHKIRIETDVDRGRLNRVGRLFGSVFRSASGVAVGALAGVFRGLELVSRMLGNVGDASQSMFGRVANRLDAVAGKTGHWGQMIAQVVAGFISLGVVVGIVVAIINVIGALIVAAIAAVAAIGSVILGAAALLALPGVFAGVTAALIAMGDENDKVKKQFGELAKTIRNTLMTTAKPMVDLFSSSIEKLNKALKKGSPLYNELSLAFDQAARAIEPLRGALYKFATEALSGVNAALAQMNWDQSLKTMSAGIAGLGTVIGNFARNLSVYGPQFASGFNSLVAGFNRIQAAMARWMGAFARFSPSVIESLTGAIEKLFDTFSTNARTFTNAAAALGDAIRDATPGIHKIATAFAQMAPGVFDALAEAINNLGDAVDDPAVVQGLANITSGIIKLTGVLLKWGTQLTGIIGNSFSNIRNQWEKLNGTLNRGIDISVAEFQRVIRQEKSARDKVNIGLRQLDHSVSRHTQNISNGLNEYRGKLFQMMNSADQSVSNHVRSLATKLWEMSDQWREAGGKVSADWKKTWDQIGKQIDASGNEALIGIKDSMNKLIADSERFREKMKSNLIKALKAEGVEVTDTLIDRIDEQLGLLESSAQTRSAQAIEAFRQNFSQLPGIVQTALEESKTPEQFQKKLERINEVMAQMTPKIAESFGKLPQEMQKTLLKSQEAFQTWKGMEVFREKVATSVGQVATELQKLVPAAETLMGSFSRMGQWAGSAGQSMHVLNNRVHWTHWIFGQLAASAGAASRAVGQVSNSGVTAGNAFHTLNQRSNGLHSSMVKAGGSARSAARDLDHLGTRAANTGGQFGTFATNVSNKMVLAHKAVGSWTHAMEQRLNMFRSRATSHGNLSSFVASVRASMVMAEDAVAASVSNMLANLNRLNTTVTARVRVETERVPVPSEITPNFMPMAMPMMAVPMASEFTPMALTTFNSDAPSAADYTAWRRSAETILREERKSRDDGPRVVKNYTFNNEVYGPAPTEKNFVKQLRFADALYGDD